MAAANPFSLIRRSASLRALATSNSAFEFSRRTPRILLPLHRQRFMRCISASADEEASAKAAASVAESGGPTIFMRCISASADEEASAKAAASVAESGGPTIFDKIISKEIPSTIVYEDNKVLAFRDINPQAPVHVVLIPKIRDGLTQLSKAEARHSEVLGHLLYASKIVAEKEGIADGFRVVINNGPAACQSVYHLHLHVLGGRQMKWPPG